MEHSLEQTISLLARTPATLNAFFHDLPKAWAHRNEGSDTWTTFDVIGHLAHCERSDWMPRTRMIQQSGESQAFAPLDRGGHTRENHGKSLQQLLDEFADLCSANLHDLRALNLQPEDLERRGRHPSFGSVTLSELLVVS